ncbi:hypothetical protein [Mycobacterium uberis]|uniref:hypothetical protein n=1 Tax=Mycobacterium uberis TaxID=2162698 RepID=UPI001FB33276|nr:hypothetical protein [Mycobacterium uberis]
MGGAIAPGLATVTASSEDRAGIPDGCTREGASVRGERAVFGHPREGPPIRCSGVSEQARVGGPRVWH